MFNSNCRNKIFCILIFFSLAFFTENAVCEQPKKRDYWPTGDWKASAPEQQGMDSAKLLIADEFIQNRLPDTFSLLVVKNGYLVFEKYYSWGSPEKIAVVPELDLVVAVTSNPGQPHPPTSIHYSPLFDLVAASVKRKRPSKNPLTAVALPADVKAFITDYDQARFNKGSYQKAKILDNLS
jgi:hypothetical protein